MAVSEMMGTGNLVAPNVAPTSTNEDDGSNKASSDNHGTNDVENKQSRPVPAVTFADVSKAFIPAIILLVAIFWINLSHLYGMFHNQGKYTKKAKVALVDFDGGSMGQTLMTIAASLNQTFSFPTYEIIDPTRTSPEELRHQVFTGHYWGAVYSSAGATDRWLAATNGTATSYNSSDTYFYVTLTQRYYAFYEENFYVSSLTVAEGAASVFSAQVASPALETASTTELASSTARTAYTAPITPVEVYAAFQDFTADIKALFNTIGTVMPILMQFFFLMAWNGIGNGLHMYAAAKRRTHITYRLAFSFLWPVITGLCNAGWNFAFKGPYPLGAAQFFALWAVTTLFACISFDVLDIITTFVPIGFVPFIFLTWIIFSVAASLGDPAILNDWYRISYFFPSLHWWKTCITIYSKGGVNVLHYTLPTLFAWLIVVKCISIVAIKYRVKTARAAFAANPSVIPH